MNIKKMLRKEKSLSIREHAGKKKILNIVDQTQ